MAIEKKGMMFILSSPSGAGKTTLTKKIAENKLSVRQSENLVRALRNKKNLKVVLSKDSNILDLEKSLVDKTGINVEIKNNKNNSGRLSFEYRNLEQLDRLINIIKNNY